MAKPKLLKECVKDCNMGGRLRPVNKTETMMSLTFTRARDGKEPIIRSVCISYKPDEVPKMREFITDIAGKELTAALDEME